MEKVYKKQFMLAKNPVDAVDVNTAALSCGLCLTYHKRLRVQFIKGLKTGSEYVLIGFAIQSLPGLSDPEELLAGEEFTSVGDMTGTWSGRWCLIIGNRIYTDVCGMLGIFYSNSASGGAAASGSIAWLRDEFGFSKREDYMPFSYGAMIDYLPGPSTLCDGVSRLMNMQYLCYRNGEFVAGRNMALREQSEDKETLLKLLSESLAVYLRNCHRIFPSIYLPLSGGYDSRTNFSILVGSGVPFTAYTCVKKHMTNADRTMPPKLCAEYGVSHRYIRPDGAPEMIEERLREFDAHTAGQCVDRDREYYGFGQHPKPDGQPTMLVGGGLWQFSHKDMKRIDDIDEFIKSAGANNKFTETLLNDYVKYVKDNPSDIDIGIYDRFYIEQRLGCWLSTIEQALDLTDCVRLQPLSCAYMLSLYMKLGSCYERPNDVEKDIIRMNAPKLLQYPFNKRTAFEKIYRPFMLDLRAVKARLKR